MRHRPDLIGPVGGSLLLDEINQHVLVLGRFEVVGRLVVELELQRQIAIGFQVLVDHQRLLISPFVHEQTSVAGNCFSVKEKSRSRKLLFTFYLSPIAQRDFQVAVLLHELLLDAEHSLGAGSAVDVAQLAIVLAERNLVGGEAAIVDERNVFKLILRADLVADELLLEQLV